MAYRRQPHHGQNPFKPYPVGEDVSNDDLRRDHVGLGGTLIFDIFIKIVILCIVIAVVVMCGFLLFRNHHLHKNNNACRPRGNDCLIGKMDNHGHCIQPSHTKKHGAKCESQCFVPEDENSTLKNHICAKTYDLIDGQERTECIGSVPIGTCEIDDDCSALVFNDDIEDDFSAGLQTSCVNGSCVWEVNPYIGYSGPSPTGCENDHMYRARCNALLNNTQSIFGCLSTTVLCSCCTTNDSSVVDLCRWENKYSQLSGGSWDPDFDIFV